MIQFKNSQDISPELPTTIFAGRRSTKDEPAPWLISTVFQIRSWKPEAPACVLIPL